MTQPDYTSKPITMGRWSEKPKQMIQVTFKRDGSGMKSRAMRLLRDGLKCYYSHRLGYVVSQRKFAKFERLYAEGWDASVMTGELWPPTRKGSAITHDKCM